MRFSDDFVTYLEDTNIPIIADNQPYDCTNVHRNTDSNSSPPLRLASAIQAYEDALVI